MDKVLRFIKDSKGELELTFYPSEEQRMAAQIKGLPEVTKEAMIKELLNNYDFYVRDDDRLGLYIGATRYGDNVDLFIFFPKEGVIKGYPKADLWRIECYINYKTGEHIYKAYGNSLAQVKEIVKEYNNYFRANLELEVVK